MNESQEVQEAKDDEQIKKALAGYQVAIRLWGFRSQQFWAEFAAMMVGNSIILKVATDAIDSQQCIPALSMGMAFVGLVLCVLWWMLLTRSIGYTYYYLHCARELEEQFLKSAVRTVSNGELFGKGKPVEPDISGERKPIEMPHTGRIPAKWTFRLFVCVFALVYSTILALGLICNCARVLCTLFLR